MTVTAQTFRGNFPAFADTGVFQTGSINYWITLAYKLHNADRWGELLDDGVQLYIAHQLSLEFNANQSAAMGNNPGAVVGALTNGSVDKVSYSRDASSSMDPSNGHWNLSIYGLRWITLARQVGMGPVYVGAPNPNDPGMSQSAWPGPSGWPNPQW